MKLRLTFILFLTFINISINAQEYSFEKVKKESQKKDSLINTYEKHSDKELLDLGFYKITRDDSLFYLLQNKRIIERLDFNGIDEHTKTSAILTINKILDEIQTHFKISTSQKIYNSNPKIRNNVLFSLNSEEQQKSKSHLTENTYYCFPNNWYNSICERTLRLEPSFKIYSLFLLNRGYFVKMENNNPLLTRDFSPADYVKSVTSLNDSLITFLSLPRKNQGTFTNSNTFNKLLTELITEKNIRISNNIELYSDTISIACISYYPKSSLDKEHKKVNHRPVLELFFPIYGSDKRIIISNGKEYGFYVLDRIYDLQKTIQ